MLETARLLLHVSAERAFDFVRLNVVSGTVPVLDHMIVVKRNFRVVDGPGEFLPVLNVELLQGLLVQRRLLHGLSVRLVGSCVVAVGALFLSLRHVLALVMLIIAISSP